ncbi:MAG TPA: peptide ABC transporter substrate-binding protein [Anaerolineales bacterium]|nr:peptide ABC transporter substrate-binding protein [Anaerolineales bacterium]
MNRKLYALLAVLVFASMVLAACGPAATGTAAPASGANLCQAGSKCITIAYEQEPDNLTGEYSNMSFAVWIDQIIGAGLGKWDDKNNFVPELATEIPSSDNGGVSADGLTITWHLKPDLKWSDGQPLTSKDIAFTWKSMVDPANAPISRSGWDKISSVDTPDDQTAVLHFSALYPPWPTLFTNGPNNGGQIMPAHLLEGKTGLEKDPEVHSPTVSGGPFMIKEWIAGDHLTLVPNPNYYEGKPKLDVIYIKFVPDPEAGLAALKAGDVDLMVNLAESDIESVKALEPQGIHLRVDGTPDFEHLFFNLGTTAGVTLPDGTVVGKSDVDGFCPFKDVNVRKAIMLGIDRLTFIKSYLKEDEKAFIATLWPNQSYTNASLTPYPYDPDQANSLLDAAGYPKGADGIRAGTCDGNPVTFSLGIETTNAQRRVDDVLEIQSELKKIGIDIKPNHLPAGTFFGSYTEGADMPLGKFDMAIFTTGYYPDPDSSSNWDCKDVTSKDNPSGANNYHICDPKLDDLFNQGLASVDPATRKTAYDAVQQYMYDNVLMVPLYARANVYGFADRLVFPPSSGFSGWAWDTFNFDVK